MLKARYIMIGGFLGAGKTTAILQVARRLASQNLRVGLITNDQSIGLVDTTMLSAHGFPTEEISGGCFCCKFNSLVEASNRLQAGARPDVFLAEPVGSCTDLVATVSFPLRQMYGETFAVAPLSVLVDPVRAQRILGLKHGKTFAPKVRYIYDRQLEEADFIVVNKIDLLDARALQELESALHERYPGAAVAAISARTGEGLDAWIERISNPKPARTTAMEVDYDTYADGEALLGWVNISAALAGDAFDGNRFLAELVRGIQQSLQGGREQEAIGIAHLKATLAPGRGHDIAVANLVCEDAMPELAHRLVGPLERGELIVNLRAEGDPQLLSETALRVLRHAAEQFRLALTVHHREAFRPARPTPTHRLAEG